MSTGGIAGRELRAERILAAQIALHERAVDDRHRRRCRAVVGGEIASAARSVHAHRVEEARADERWRVPIGCVGSNGSPWNCTISEASSVRAAGTSTVEPTR